MDPIRVVVYGALGKMGKEIINGLYNRAEIKIVGAVDLNLNSERLILPDNSGWVPLSDNLDSILSEAKPDVLVDFTVASATMQAAPVAGERGVNLVIGTTGLNPNDIEQIGKIVSISQIGAVVAPNFALGAVLMMHLAGVAGKHFNSAEIIELHHDQKVDAPSGTARATAKLMSETRTEPFKQSLTQQHLNSRGESVNGVRIHSVRLPGLLAHQEVILGAAGQTLHIKHNTISRQCFIPGIVMAIEVVVKRKGFVYGLDNLLGL